MSNFVFHALNYFGRFTPKNSLLLLSTTQKSVVLNQLKLRHTKHWNPKWKKFRKEKVIKVKLPNYNEPEDEELSQEKIRSKLKEQGLMPSRPWIEKQIFLGCTGAVFEPYIPPEGDGKFSVITTTGVKQKADFMKKKGTSYLAVRKIRTFDEDFSIGDFEDEAQQIYLKAHEAIAKKDKENLRLYVTEKAYPEVQHNTLDKTIHWRFNESLELPRIVHARCTHIITKENIFAQLTVRFHNQQTLAVYDRFGRLMHGSEIVKKDVLEYVVFEKHLANQYGTWRIHAKIIPPWMPEREYANRTYTLKPEEPPKEESNTAVKDSTPPINPTVASSQNDVQPQINN
ncbi:probable 39S ribosomal protein L45, mitochondrial [Microplitis mediator]|uniref:probable 39S ribosomal protein L45, mitochondrial n=1 Tax=Microplitis mediator TaxID=375433 RepID=UPI0025564798|nr:probable 39S ribosomal protein L45, mitochondrial [Microplitis mediator]